MTANHLHVYPSNPDVFNTSRLPVPPHLTCVKWLWATLQPRHSPCHRHLHANSSRYFHCLSPLSNTQYPWVLCSLVLTTRIQSYPLRLKCPKDHKNTHCLCLAFFFPTSPISSLLTRASLAKPDLIFAKRILKDSRTQDKSYFSPQAAVNSLSEKSLPARFNR